MMEKKVEHFHCDKRPPNDAISAKVCEQRNPNTESDGGALSVIHPSLRSFHLLSRMSLVRN